MSDPYETWLHERWPKLTSVEGQIAETAWNECEKQQQAEVERLTAELAIHETQISTANDAMAENTRLMLWLRVARAEIERLTAHVVNYRTAGKVTDDVIERLEAENERLTAEHLADLARINLLTDGLRDSLYKADKEHAALCEIHKSDQDEIERLWERLRNQRDTFVEGLEEGE